MEDLKLKKMNFKGVLLLLSALAIMGILAGCSSEKEEKPTEKEATEKTSYAEKVKENPVVTITLENDKQIMMELEPKVAPNTVANFISLVEDGFYDGLIFHRVIPGFMIQGGDPSGNGTGGSENNIKGEFASNNFENNLAHERGVVSMARAQDPDSASSQFFIMVENADSLDGDYAAFGKVTEGMDAVDEIVSVDRNDTDKPLKDQKMKKVEVDTKGFDYPDPEVIK